VRPHERLVRRLGLSAVPRLLGVRGRRERMLSVHWNLLRSQVPGVLHVLSVSCDADVDALIRSIAIAAPTFSVW